MKFLMGIAARASAAKYTSAMKSKYFREIFKFLFSTGTKYPINTTLWFYDFDNGSEII